MPSRPHLVAVIYCAPEATRLNGDKLSESLLLPEKLSPSRAIESLEVGDRFFMSHLRPADIPLAFHRAAEDDFQVHGRTYRDNFIRLEAIGRKLQYLFSDGLILTASQVLYHPHSKQILRHLLPLSVNVTSEVREASSAFGKNNWETEAESVILSVLLAATRGRRMMEKLALLEKEEGGETTELEPSQRAPLIYYAHSDATNEYRDVAPLEKVEVRDQAWGPWRVTTEIADPQPHDPQHAEVHHGRARIELDPESLPGVTSGLAARFLVDVELKLLLFHDFEDQLARLRARATLSPSLEGTPKSNQNGLFLRLNGHGAIQTTIQEINDLLSEESGRRLKLHPTSTVIAADKVRPELSLLGDGSFRVMFKVDAPDGEWELHGLPQSSAYLLLNLQLGLGATTGYANTQIAHARRGLKRERDMKVLRSLGLSALIFHDAVNFALGRPLSDGTEHRDEKELLNSLFERVSSVVLKGEGWPTQAGGLQELCSKNVTTLIEGFVRQVISDVKEEGREVSIYLPAGEYRIKGLARSVCLLFHSIVSDLALKTSGAIFGRARTKYFENFLSGRMNPEREDLAVRRSVEPEIARNMVYQIGVNERYQMPEGILPPACPNVLSLINEDFEISIDGKLVEEFAAEDFKPEFTLHEESAEQSDAFIHIGAKKIDWFELHPKFFFRGVEIKPEQAMKLSRDGLFEFEGKLYRVRAQDMPQLARLNRFWKSIQSSQVAHDAKSKRRKTEDTYFQLPRSRTLELLALRNSGIKVRGGPMWDDICRFYDSLDQERAPLEMPESFKASLQPYQKVGSQWILDLYRLRLGGILADDMGLGKTVTSLAVLETLRTRDELGACLILVPTSLTYNWLSESARFTPDLAVEIFQSRDPETMRDFLQKNRHGVVICTYGLLQEHIEHFQQVEWNMVVFDEAQNLKNITTKRTTAARKLAPAAFKLCLTGTPIENHYGELYSLFDLMVPGSLGELPDFRERFVNPSRVMREDLADLKLKTKPLLLRRTKAQVMHQLPPKVEATIKLPFEDQQRRIYRDIATSYNEQVKAQISRLGESKAQLQMLTALLRLRQACSDPSAIPGVKYTGEPPKVSTLLEALKEVTESGASALVFTQFLATYERIRSSLTASNIPHYDISGADSRLAREKKLRGFQEDPNGAVMLMTLKTGGVGLNLVKASYIFHIEPWWNPAVENQATDRAHRIGQTRTVQVYRYLIKDSVEEKIEILKDIKNKRFDAMFNEAEREDELGSGSSRLSQRDFEFLLS